MKLLINGQDMAVEADPDTPLIYVLRNELELKGTRFGCGLGLCGSCTVLAGDEAIFSCDTPIWAVEGKPITTIEGLAASPDSSSLFDAFVEEQAGQCGYCLSGVIVRTEALLRRSAAPERTEVAAALERNLCRCGAHARILRAIDRAAAARRPEQL